MSSLCLPSTTLSNCQSCIDWWHCCSKILKNGVEEEEKIPVQIHDLSAATQKNERSAWEFGGGAGSLKNIWTLPFMQKMFTLVLAQHKQWAKKDDSGKRAGGGERKLEKWAGKTKTRLRRRGALKKLETKCLRSERVIYYTEGGRTQEEPGRLIKHVG